ncbi:unnamed protein product [Amoebophrya sp. A120]|nr:unnamed protein product [Amoebophrya sp. A120]|eukprot:GSA120T00021106001.1
MAYFSSKNAWQMDQKAQNGAPVSTGRTGNPTQGSENEAQSMLLHDLGSCTD